MPASAVQTQATDSDVSNSVNASERSDSRNWYPAAFSLPGIARRPVSASAGSVRNAIAPSLTSQAGVGGAGGRWTACRSARISSTLRTGFGLVACTTPLKRFVGDHAVDDRQEIIDVQPRNPLPSVADATAKTPSSDRRQAVECRSVPIEHHAGAQNHLSPRGRTEGRGFPSPGDVAHLRRLIADRAVFVE